MTSNAIKQFVQLRTELVAERRNLETRLAAINQALGETTATSAATPSPRTGQQKRVMSPAWREAQRRRWARVRAKKNPAPSTAQPKAGPKKATLRETIVRLVTAKRLNRQELIAGLKTGGFSSKSIGQYLYGKQAVVKNVSGKFGPK